MRADPVADLLGRPAEAVVAHRVDLLRPTGGDGLSTEGTRVPATRVSQNKMYARSRLATWIHQMPQRSFKRYTDPVGPCIQPALARGDAVILTENNSNDNSKITV